LFTGDVLNASDRMDLTTAGNYNSFILGWQNWDDGNGTDQGQTVPGWYFYDEVDWEAVNQDPSDSRWDVQAVYSYAAGEGYTLVMSRSLSGEQGLDDPDDLDMSELTRVRARIGILDGHKLITTGGSSQQKFSVDFYLDLPQ
jgi:hypothetical protein